ncbi:hypothetical protein [Endozoicomonas arenosclerae]|nr:hypothetical protein [Endozoicomonas arenosclerae]
MSEKEVIEIQLYELTRRLTQVVCQTQQEIGYYEESLQDGTLEY